MAANPSIKNANQIKAGQSIKIPDSGVMGSVKRFFGITKRDSNPYKGMSQAEMDAGKSVPKVKKDKKVYKDKIMRDAEKKKKNNKSSTTSSTKKKGLFDDPVDRKVKKKKKASSADTDKKYFPGTNITPTNTQRNRMRKRMGGGT
jgi:hypothetical protein